MPGRTRSPDFDLRAARKQGFPYIGLLRENHLDDALLRLALGHDSGLRIYLKRAAAAGMTHQLLNDLHVFSIRDENR